jgi:hypothetical protein
VTGTARYIAEAGGATVKKHSRQDLRAGLAAGLLLARLRRVFLANNRGQAKVGEASEHLGGNIGTVLVVAEVFGEQFFVSVWSREARFDGYPRNRRIPPPVLSDG